MCRALGGTELLQGGAGGKKTGEILAEGGGMLAFGTGEGTGYCLVPAEARRFTGWLGLLQADVLCLRSAPFPVPPAISLASEARSPLAADSPPAFVEGAKNNTYPPRRARLSSKAPTSRDCGRMGASTYAGRKKGGRSRQRGWERHGGRQGCWKDAARG